VLERKVNFSNAGTRTDIFAAGSNIMSSHNTPGVADPRNSSYYKTNLSGTSMASPQVTGIIACALETYPNMTPAQALTYVQTYANSGVLANPTINTDFSANELKNVNTLFNGPNLFMTYRPERGDQYQVYPTRDYSYRPASGRVYPRPRIRRFG
jgi:subtilisin family serine protease